MIETFSIIVGAFLAGVVGISTQFIISFCNRRKTKKDTAKGFLLEIKTNQNILRSLSNARTKINSSIDYSEKKDRLPNALYFSTFIFYNSADKMGLFDSECVKMAFRYYDEIKHIQNDYLRYILINGIYISEIQDNKARYESGKSQNIHPGWCETEEFLINAEKIFNSGEKLTKCLSYECI